MNTKALAIGVVILAAGVSATVFFIPRGVDVGDVSPTAAELALISEAKKALDAPKTPVPAPTPIDVNEANIDPKWVARVSEIAREYQKLDKVTDELRISPELCRAWPLPFGPQASMSGDAATHGRKMHHLYTSEGWAYWFRVMNTSEALTREWPIDQTPIGKAAAGTVVVKEAFQPIDGVLRTATRSELKIDPQSKANEPKYLPVTTGSFDGLFIMFKVEPGTPGTDEGWVYATVGQDRTTITSAGAVASCIDCHRDSTCDRLLGPPAFQRQYRGMHNMPLEPRKGEGNAAPVK